MTAILGRLYHHFLLHGAGLGSVVIHLRSRIKIKKSPDYLKSLSSSASAARQAQAQRRNNPSKTGPVACGKRREAEGRQVGG